MRWIVAAALVASTGLYCVHRAALPAAMASGSSPAAVMSSGRSVADLQDTLEKGLRARLPADFVFIRKVTLMVEQNELPERMVMGTFNWVRKNRSHKKYLVAYFAQVLRRRAAQIGVTID